MQFPIPASLKNFYGRDIRLAAIMFERRTLDIMVECLRRGLDYETSGRNSLFQIERNPLLYYYKE
ncbi:hypothetical protein HYY71_06585 [Candidatus Woesearchaeota archaeon]|nr:hypothetical protein [Candidatus Woesearchaeota archaeon]